MGRRDNQRHYRTQVENKLHANAWRHPKLRARTRLLEHAAGERDQRAAARRQRWTAVLVCIVIVAVLVSCLIVSLLMAPNGTPILPQPPHDPPRFFAFYTDDQLQALVREEFDVESFTRIELGADQDLHFQSCILRKNVLLGKIAAPGGSTV